MFRVPAGTEMTPELLAKYIGKHKREIALRYKKLHDAYENEYEIQKLPKKEAYKPDNRIPVNFAKYITDTMNGFFIGIPIKAQSDDKVVNDYIEFLDQYNDQDDNNAELSKLCSIYGKGYEMYYNDAESNIAITYLSPMEAFMIYDESIIERSMFFVRYYRDSSNVERGSWSDGRIVQHFHNNGSYGTGTRRNIFLMECRQQSIQRTVNRSESSKVYCQSLMHTTRLFQKSQMTWTILQMLI